MEKAGLYIHIPFCEKKCEYCDFYSVTRLDDLEAFIGALQTEMRLYAPTVEDWLFQTVFFGGGTPSLLSESQLEKIWKAIHNNFRIAPGAEVTLEANPGTLNRNKLNFARQLGFNRLSMGVQSFNAPELLFLGRTHTAHQALENFYQARDAGFQNINLDLMTAFPGLTPAHFANTLRQASQLKPEHISCYTLIFEPGTPFYRKKELGILKPVAEEQEARYYQMALEFLEAQGYHSYEISNFAIGEAFRCRHNLIYWEHYPYLGLGPSAHSFWKGIRRANKRSVKSYISDLKKEQLPLQMSERLNSEQLNFEYIFLHLRLKEGIPLTEYRKRFGIELLEKYGRTVHRLKQEGFLAVENDRLALTRKGWLVADAVSAYF